MGSRWNNKDTRILSLLTGYDALFRKYAREKTYREISGPLLLTWFNFNPWISNHRLDKDEITYSFLNFNGCTVEV